MIWGLTPATLKKRLAAGFVKVIPGKRGKIPTLYYLTSGRFRTWRAVTWSSLAATRTGLLSWSFATGKATLPTTQWDRESHNAQSNGTGLLTALLPSRKFPYAKSLYAVEDCLRLAVGEKPHAIVLDFFAGSGTTAHAVMRLNHQDGRSRQCISVTNNEVAATEHDALRRNGSRPGDADWERWGICDYITKPRVEAAITGRTPDGEPIKGTTSSRTNSRSSRLRGKRRVFYLTTKLRFRSTITSPSPASRRCYGCAPVASASGSTTARRGLGGGGCLWPARGYGCGYAFVKAVAKAKGLRVAYIVTDDDRRFQAIARRLPEGAEPVRLYESYLTNFSFANGNSG